MPTVNFTESAQIGGLAISGASARSGEGLLTQDVTIAAAKTGTLTTRTDNDTGVITLTGGHGIVTSDVISIFWDGGARYNIVASVSTNALTVDAGAGDNLPIATTAVTVCVQTVIDCDFDEADLQLLMCHCSRKGLILFHSAGALMAALQMPEGEPWSWKYDDAISYANPLTSGPVDSIRVANADSAGTNRIKIGAVLNSVA